MMLNVRIYTMELLKSTEIGANNGVYKMLFPKGFLKSTVSHESYCLCYT